MASGLIFDIKRYAIHDGPGIRVTVFFKGCYLNCAWCHNPESRSVNVQKMYTASKCIGCQSCVEACPEQALTLTLDGIITDRSKCNLNGACTEVCPTGAMEMCGTERSVEYIVNAVEKETVFFDHSGGGVTFSGGEPLMHADILIELLDACGNKGIHRTVDTSGFAKREVLLEVAKRTDHFLYDLKLMDADMHKKWTGVDNTLILDNLRELSGTGASINIRIPLIKGINDDEDNMRRTAEFIASLQGERKSVSLLPYHNTASKKYFKLGQDLPSSNFDAPDEKIMKSIITLFGSYGVHAMIGG